jgi:pimeloyl-ACP methyl ester carboxylesterase
VSAGAVPPAARLRAAQRDRTGASTVAGDPRRRELTRRDLLRLIAVGATGGAGLAGLLQADHEFGTGYWAAAADVELIDATAAAKVPRSATVVLPGFNVYGGGGVASSLTPSLRTIGRVAAVFYGNSTLDLQLVLQLVLRFARTYQLDAITLYGHSMGGMVALDLAPLLTARGLSVPAVILDCSPMDNADVKPLRTHPELITLSHALSRSVKYVGPGGVGALHVLAGKLPSPVDQEALHGLIDYTRRTLSNEQCAPDMVLKQLAYIQGFDLTRTAARLPASLQLAYLAAREPDADRVVDSPASIGRLQPLANQLLVLRGATAHADPGSAPVEYNSMLTTVIEVLDLYTGATQRSHLAPR